MAMATQAYWLMGLLYPTAEVGRFFIWLQFLRNKSREEHFSENISSYEERVQTVTKGARHSK